MAVLAVPRAVAQLAVAAVLGAGCGDADTSSTAPDAVDGATDDGPPLHMADVGPSHTHGMGTLTFHMHAMQFWKDTRELLLGTHFGLYRTESGGDELVLVYDGGLGKPLSEMKGPDFKSLAQSPFDPNVYWGGGHFADGDLFNWGFVESTDGGKSWGQKSFPLGDFHHLATTPASQGLIAGVLGGPNWSQLINVSMDSGATWVSYPWPKAPTDMVIENPSGPVLLLSSIDGIERLTLPSQAVETVVAAQVTALTQLGDGFLYATAEAGLVVCDGSFGDCVDAPAPTLASVDQLLTDPDDPESFYALTSQSQIFHTHDRGDTWDLLVDGN